MQKETGNEIKVNFEEEYKEYNEAFEQIPDDPAGLEDTLADLKRAFHEDREKRDYQFRIEQLRSLREGLTAMKDELCAAIEADLGRGKFYGYISEVFLVGTELDHVIANLGQWMGETSVRMPMMLVPGMCSYVYEPLGVVLVMSAWNYPYYTLLGPLSQIIAAGNCAVIKPSEISPRCSAAMVKLVQNYLHPKYYRVVPGKAEIAKRLTSLRFDKIVFTGSTQKGKLVAASAASNLVPCVLELGGKSPAIVDDSAKVEFAAKKILFGKMPNFGQVCIAPDYILCHQSQTKALIQSLKTILIESYKGCPTPEESGKMVNLFHYKRVWNLIKGAGGEIVIGGLSSGKLEMTAILNPDKKSQLMKEEIFGPVFPIIEYEDIQEAIDYVRYEQGKPLVVYYFGERAGVNMKKVEAMTSSGAFVVNETIYQILNADLPFGGVGHSGYGRYHGKFGFEAFSNQKSKLVRPAVDFWPLNMVYPPYSEARQKVILRVLDVGSISIGAFFAWIILLLFFFWA